MFSCPNLRCINIELGSAAHAACTAAECSAALARAISKFGTFYLQWKKALV